MPPLRHGGAAGAAPTVIAKAPSAPLEPSRTPPGFIEAAERWFAEHDPEGAAGSCPNATQCKVKGSSVKNSEAIDLSL